MELSIMSQWEVLKWNESVVRPSLLISITDPNPLEPLIFNNPFLEVLPLQFHDLTFDHGHHDVQPMSSDDAKQIKLFLDKQDFSMIQTLAVHCHAGLSRSPAVMAAIALYLGLSDDFIWQGHYLPNRYCFELLNQELNLGLSRIDIDVRYQQNADFLSRQTRTLDPLFIF